MPRRRKSETTHRRIRGIGWKRIRIPQPPDRPVRLLARRPIRREKYEEEDWWFIQHRKGIRRPKVGEDPLEARAVKKETVKGSLPERIVYKWLVSTLRMVPDVDFDFHSSMEGGRIELGGIDVDFIFPFMKMSLEVQGPTHVGYLRQRKDDEKRLILADYGYTAYEIDEDEVYDIDRFETKMRKIFNITPGRNFFAGSSNPSYYAGDVLDPKTMQEIFDSLVRSEIMLRSYQLEL